jgi:hypothetical protein
VALSVYQEGSISIEGDAVTASTATASPGTTVAPFTIVPIVGVNKLPIVAVLGVLIALWIIGELIGG